MAHVQCNLEICPHVILGSLKIRSLIVEIVAWGRRRLQQRLSADLYAHKLCLFIALTQHTAHSNRGGSAGPSGSYTRQNAYPVGKMSQSHAGRGGRGDAGTERESARLVPGAAMPGFPLPRRW